MDSTRSTAFLSMYLSVHVHVASEQLLLICGQDGSFSGEAHRASDHTRKNQHILSSRCRGRRVTCTLLFHCPNCVAGGTNFFFDISNFSSEKPNVPVTFFHALPESLSLFRLQRVYTLLKEKRQLSIP